MVTTVAKTRDWETDQSGVQMLTDKGRSIINWPEQHYRNGVDKNSATGRRYKRAVRILKMLRNEMAKQGVRAAQPIPSFLAECLVWNAPADAAACPSGPAQAVALPPLQSARSPKNTYFSRSPRSRRMPPT